VLLGQLEQSLDIASSAAGTAPIAAVPAAAAAASAVAVSPQSSTASAALVGAGAHNAVSDTVLTLLVQPLLDELFRSWQQRLEAGGVVICLHNGGASSYQVL